MKKIKQVGFIILATVLATGCGNKTTENIAEQYCNILVKGNYGDILDIAYLPQSDLITKEKIEEAKQNYFVEMSKNNNTITTCEANQTNEDDEKIYYKLIKNGTDTENIEVDKKTNKIIIKDLYVNSEIKVGDDTTVYIDGVELKNPEKKSAAEPGKTLADFEYYQDSYERYLKQLEEYVYVYKVTSLKYADYKIKYTHVFYKDYEQDLCKNDGCSNSQYINGYMSSGYIKDETLVSSLKNTFKEIALVGFEGKDKSPVSKYFSSSDAMTYIDIFKKERKSNPNDGSGSETYVYKKLQETEDVIMLKEVYYINENEIKVRIQVNYTADISHWFRGTKEGGACVIADVTLKKYKNSWQIVSFENVVYG